MKWYSGAIGKLHNDKCIIYTFIGEFINGTPKRPEPDHHNLQAGNGEEVVLSGRGGGTGGDGETTN